MSKYLYIEYKISLLACQGMFADNHSYIVRRRKGVEERATIVGGTASCSHDIHNEMTASKREANTFSERFCGSEHLEAKERRKRGRETMDRHVQECIGCPTMALQKPMY